MVPLLTLNFSIASTKSLASLSLLVFTNPYFLIILIHVTYNLCVWFRICCKTESSPGSKKIGYRSHLNVGGFPLFPPKLQLTWMFFSFIKLIQKKNFRGLAAWIPFECRSEFTFCNTTI